jgi:hypothetical protein
VTLLSYVVTEHDPEYVEELRREGAHPFEGSCPLGICDGSGEVQYLPRQPGHPEAMDPQCVESGPCQCVLLDDA